MTQETDRVRDALRADRPEMPAGVFQMLAATISRESAARRDADDAAARLRPRQSEHTVAPLTKDAARQAKSSQSPS